MESKGLGSETIPSGQYAGTYYYLGDGSGSVAALTSGSGAVVIQYSYDPNGNMTSSGSVPNAITYRGAIYDSTTGLYKMGGSYYDPRIGQSTQGYLMGGTTCHDQGWSEPAPGGPLSGEDYCGEEETAVITLNNAFFSNPGKGHPPPSCREHYSVRFGITGARVYVNHCLVVTLSFALSHGGLAAGVAAIAAAFAGCGICEAALGLLGIHLFQLSYNLTYVDTHCNNRGAYIDVTYLSVLGFLPGFGGYKAPQVEKIC